MKAIIVLGILGFLVAPNAWCAGLQMGQPPPKLELTGDLGGTLEGKPWSSETLKGKVHVIFYVDPDEKDLNNEASEALKKENLPKEAYQSLGIINMAATWMPNFAISSSLEEKQKQYPSTLYLRDYKKTFVKTWGIADDTSDVLAFDKTGNLIFRKDGKLTQEEIKDLVAVVKKHIKD